jgi:glycosyltransferase involved in cell wall biosynthesis
MRTSLFSPGADSLERYARGGVLFVGRLDRQKDAATLLRAWRLLMDRGVSARLTIVGSGPEERRLKALARDLAIRASVDFAGHKQQEELPRYYQNNSVFTLPSASEAFGQVIVEAGLCGLATVATDVGGIPESVAHEQTGLLVPPGSPAELCAALARFLGDPELARRMGREAQRRFRERWRYDATMSAYVEMLAKVAGKGSARHSGGGSH